MIMIIIRITEILITIILITIILILIIITIMIILINKIPILITIVTVIPSLQEALLRIPNPLRHPEGWWSSPGSPWPPMIWAVQQKPLLGPVKMNATLLSSLVSTLICSFFLRDNVPVEILPGPH
jgi:hypothetical protein